MLSLQHLYRLRRFGVKDNQTLVNPEEVSANLASHPYPSFREVSRAETAWATLMLTCKGQHVNQGYSRPWHGCHQSPARHQPGAGMSRLGCHANIAEVLPTVEPMDGCEHTSQQSTLHWYYAQARVPLGPNGPTQLPSTLPTLGHLEQLGSWAIPWLYQRPRLYNWGGT